MFLLAQNVGGEIESKQATVARSDVRSRNGERPCLTLQFQVELMEQLSPKGVEPETILTSQPDQIVIDTAELGRIVGKTIADEETPEIPPDKQRDARHHAVEGKAGRPEVDLA